MQTFDYNKSILQTAPHHWLRFYSKFMVVATLALIFIGSLVTSTGTGLSVPDWPSTYGHFMFSFPLSQMVGGIFYEHGHRLVASTIGFLTIVLCVWINLREKRRWVKNMAFAALGTVIVQGILGGITVIFFLPDAVSTAHAVVAQTFLILLVCISYSQSRERRLRELAVDANRVGNLVRFAVFVSALVYLQLILGAFMRHTESGLAIYDFPTMAGRYFPAVNQAILSQINSWRFDHNMTPVTLFQVVTHMAHRFGAVLVTIFSLILMVKILRNKELDKKIRINAAMILFVLGLQFSLGALTVLSMRVVAIASTHVVCGAILLGLNVLLVLRLLPVSKRSVG